MLGQGSNRMVLCWKCCHFSPRGVSEGQKCYTKIFCTLCNTFVNDLSDPPKQCPVRVEWEKDDAKAQARHTT